MRFGLSEKIIIIICNIFAKFPEIEMVKIYGSRAKGNFEKGSDIDLAFFSNKEINLTGKLLTLLDELPTPYRFDVTDYSRLTELPLKEHIDRIGMIFYERSKNGSVKKVVSKIT